MGRPKGSKNKRPYPVTEAVLAARATRYTPERNAKVRASQLGAGNSNWRGESARYVAMHTRQYRKHGRASEHLCASCFDPAAEWADLGDLQEFVPLCRPCHRWFDRKEAAA